MRSVYTSEEWGRSETGATGGGPCVCLRTSRRIGQGYGGGGTTKGPSQRTGGREKGQFFTKDSKKHGVKI